jgi:uncharacterized protein (DUF2235 family)
MAKNILIFSDGTGQDGGMRPEQVLSNVYKLYRACRTGPTSPINPAEQISFYDPGLGTDTTATGMTRVRQCYQKLHSSVTGRGITINIADCYEFIINHYQPGDRIFLFGFSRGAYTVRSVANLLMLCGVPTHIDGAPLPRFRRAIRDIADEAVFKVLEHGAGHPREEFEAERFELARRFRERYGSHFAGVDEDRHRSNVAAYFIGVFDTVAALGVKGALWWVYQSLLLLIGAVGGIGVALIATIISRLTSGAWLSPSWFALAAIASMAWTLYSQRKSIRKVITDYPEKGQRRTHYAEWKGEHFDRILSRHVTYARSANAIDELREDFARCPWGKSTDDVPFEIEGRIRLRQYWFPGNHSDVGGSYPEAESRLSDLSLAWMIEEALSLPVPLKIAPVFVNGEKMPGSGDVGEPLQLFPSVAGVQHCEVAATKDFIARLTPPQLQWATAWLGYNVKPRSIDPKAVLHPSVYERLGLIEVPQCTTFGAYRPVQLQQHTKCQSFYSQADADPNEATR